MISVKDHHIKIDSGDITLQGGIYYVDGDSTDVSTGDRVEFVWKKKHYKATVGEIVGRALTYQLILE